MKINDENKYLFVIMYIWLLEEEMQNFNFLNRSCILKAKPFQLKMCKTKTEHYNSYWINRHNSAITTLR